MKLSKSFKQALWGSLYLPIAVGMVAFFIMRFCVMLVKSVILWSYIAPRTAWRGFKLFRAIMREKRKYKTACANIETKSSVPHVKR